MKISSDEFNDLIMVIKRRIGVDKRNGKTIKYEDIDSYIDKGLEFIPISLTDEDRAEVFRAIETEEAIKHTKGNCIFDDYDDPHNWYEHAEIEDEHFWRLYSKYLLEESSLDDKSIDILDKKTLPAIMNCLCNPKEAHEGRRLIRGLVIGDVQSGKTATYSGLICKAVDAGYKVVILLAGITENLRQQTQERIDQGIVGLEIKRDDITKIEKPKRVGVGKYDKQLLASSYTTQSSDFVGQKDSIFVSLEAQRSVVLFVVIPLSAGIMTRILVIRRKGIEYFNTVFIRKFDNYTIGGLLLTLIILFSFQGETILNNPLHIVLIAVPLVLQTVLIFFVAYGWAKWWKLPHNIAAPAGMIGASNFLNYRWPWLYRFSVYNPVLHWLQW